LRGNKGQTQVEKPFLQHLFPFTHQGTGFFIKPRIVKGS
jgi:hypothetical protein